MNKEELQKKCADLVGVSASEKELAFDVLQQKIMELLKIDNDAVKIEELGVFQLKENKENSTTELIYSQIGKTNSKTMFLRLPVKRSSFDDSAAEDIFSISVGKPIVPLSSSHQSDHDTETSFVYIKKKIEERVNELLRKSEVLHNFNLWDDYLKSLPKKEMDDNSTDSKSVLDELTSPDPEPEKDEEMSTLINAFVSESELYSYPDREEKHNEVEDDIFNDLETFKNIDEHESIDGIEQFNDKPDLHNSIENESPETKKEIDDEIPRIIFNDEKLTLGDDDIFDIDKTIFNEKDSKKFDWNWGDELENELPNDDEYQIKDEETKSKVDDYVADETEEKKDEEIDTDPFGTLEQTLELDPEFKMLTSESPAFQKTNGRNEEEYRITNLNKPRPIPPPKTKTRYTRLTNPVEDISKKSTIASTEVSGKIDKKNKSGYKSFRESSSGSNMFVIAGIIVILVVIIYFAFSMGDEPSKQLLQPSSKNVPIQTETDIVTSEPTQVVPPSTGGSQSSQSNVAASKKDNTSQVEEIRISNLIFRRGNEYNVQVSSWRSPIKAEDEVKRLKAKGYKAFSVQAYLPSKGGTWHRVRIGGFKSENEARNFLNNTQL